MPFQGMDMNKLLHLRGVTLHTGFFLHLIAKPLLALLALTAAVPSAAETSLWIGGERVVERLPLAADDPETVFDVPHLGALAVDQARDRVWAYADGMLHAYTLSGQHVLERPVSAFAAALQALRGERSPFVRSLIAWWLSLTSDMAVSSSTGEVWLAVGKTLYRFAADGAALGEQQFSDAITAVATESTTGTVAVASGGLVALRNDEDVETLDFTAFGRVRDLSFGPDGDVLWLVTDGPVLRQDLVSGTRSTLAASRVQKLAVDSEGAVWTLEPLRLRRFSDEGQPLLSRHAPLGWSIAALAVDLVAAADAPAVWIASVGEVVRVDVSGVIEQRLQPQRSRQVRAWALGSESLPLLRLLAPQPNATLGTPTPSLEFAYSAADPATIDATLDGSPLALDCSVAAETLQCSSEVEWSEGEHEMTAVIYNAAGVGSAPVEWSVEVDLTAPVITLGLPTGFMTNTPAIQLSGQLSEAATVSVAGEALEVDDQHTFNTSVALSEGTNDFSFKAQDAAGNTGTATLRVILDTQPPAPLQGDQVSATVASGEAVLHAAPSSVEPGAEVTATNTRTGKTAAIIAEADGSFELRIAATGGDLIELRVVDGVGNASEVRIIELDGGISVSITAPAPGAQLERDSTDVRGTFSGTESAGIVINGVVAVVTGPSTFYASDVPLARGMNALTATLTTYEGATAEDVLEIQSDAVPSPLSLTLAPNSGVAPLATTVEYSLRIDAEVTEVRLDFDGDGVIDITSAAAHGRFPRTYPEPGVYSVQLEVELSDGTVLTEKETVLVQKLSTVDRAVQARWTALNTALIQGDVDAALEHVNESARKKYGSVFEALRPHWPEIVASYTAFEPVLVISGLAEYGVSRQIDGQSRAFLIYFTQGPHGLWRVVSM